jgi:hypothetical protein
MRSDIALTDDLRSIIAGSPRQPITAPDLVCAVIKHGDNLGARLLASFRIELPPAGLGAPSGAGLSDDAEHLLDGAAEVARSLGDAAVGPEHVVIAGADERYDPTHAGAFRVLGTNADRLREQLVRLRDGDDLLEPVVDDAYLAEIERALQDLTG